VTEICPRHPTHLLDPHDSRLLTNQVPDDAGDNNIRRGFSAPKSGPAARTSLESGNHIPLTAPPLHRYAVIGGERSGQCATPLPVLVAAVRLPVGVAPEPPTHRRRGRGAVHWKSPQSPGRPSSVSQVPSPRTVIRKCAVEWVGPIHGIRPARSLDQPARSEGVEPPTF
jgi:hypothetical protein